MHVTFASSLLCHLSAYNSYMQCVCSQPVSSIEGVKREQHLDMFAVHYGTVQNSLHCAYGFRQRKQSEHEFSSKTSHMSQAHLCLPKSRVQHKPETRHLHPKVGPAQPMFP